MVEPEQGDEDRVTAGSRPSRLKKRPDFLKAAAGRKLHAAMMSIHVASRPEPAIGAPRVGFTVTKKVGGAVERNRIRRRLRAIVRTVPDLGMKPSHDYVIVARQEILNARHAAIVAGLLAAIRRVHGSSGRTRPPRSKDRSHETSSAGDRSGSDAAAGSPSHCCGE